MPLTVNGTAGPVLYLYNNAQAFGLDEPTTSGSAPGLIAFEPEVVTNGLPPLLSGAYAASTQPMPVPATMQNGETTFTLSSGGVNAFYSGTFSSKIDSSSPAGTLTSAAASTGIYLEATNGRTIVANTGSSTTVAVIYIISATKAVEISVGAGTTPTVSVLEQ